MTFKINESLYLNDLLNTERFINSSLLEKIDFLNRSRSSRKFWSYNINGILKIIEDQPTKKITFIGLIWQGKECHDISLFKSHNGDYMIEYHTNTEIFDSYISVPNFEPGGRYKTTINISKFIENGSKFHSQTNEHIKLLRYLKSIYEFAWLNLKREKVAELKKQIDKSSANEYIASRNAKKTVAIMKLMQETLNISNTVETYNNSIKIANSTAEADKYFKNIEQAFHKLRSEHYRINWNDIEIKERLPGGKLALKAKESSESG